MLLFTSSSATWTGLIIAVPDTSWVGGCSMNTSLLRAPGETVKELLVPELKPVALAVSGGRSGGDDQGWS